MREKQLEELDKKISSIIRAMFGLYPKATDKVFSLVGCMGGLVLKSHRVCTELFGSPT